MPTNPAQTICDECGAVVGDQRKHDDWHRRGLAEAVDRQIGRQADLLSRGG